MLAIMGRIQSDPLQFSYIRQISLDQKQKVKVAVTNEEGCAIDNLMARYIYCLALQKEVEINQIPMLFQLMMLKSGQE